MEQSAETMKVGQQLVDLCKRGENLKAIDQLYATDIESLEPLSSEGMNEKSRGIEAIRKKNVAWNDSMEVHSMELEGPFPFGDRFAVHYKIDATDKKKKERMKMEEVAIYTVHNGKIIREEFFYTM
jgi:hypothetical protein